MHGNVLEFCNDWYGSYSSESQNNPTGTQDGPGRVIRSGDWTRDAYLCTFSNRYYNAPDLRLRELVGFRVVRRPGEVTY